MNTIQHVSVTPKESKHIRNIKCWQPCSTWATKQTFKFLATRKEDLFCVFFQWMNKHNLWKYLVFLNCVFLQIMNIHNQWKILRLMFLVVLVTNSAFEDLALYFDLKVLKIQGIDSICKVWDTLILDFKWLASTFWRTLFHILLGTLNWKKAPVSSFLKRNLLSETLCYYILHQ